MSKLSGGVNRTLRHGLGCPVMSAKAGRLDWSLDACNWTAATRQSYRQLQELAYENHNGASMPSLFLLMLIFPLVVCLHHMVSSKFGPSPALLDAALVVFPLTIAFGSPSSVELAVAALCAVCASLALVGPTWSMSLRNRATSFSVVELVAKAQSSSPPKIRIVAEYRAVMMASTCICILAVDFASIFSREHAKTQEFGVSLMDLGTGCIVCASAITSKQARGLSTGRALGRRILSIWPVVLIGLVRFAVVWGIDYHVETSEYGVHWNFFLTIASVALVSSVADFGPVASAVAGSLLIGAYQWYLSQLGGTNFVLFAPREGFFSANREGILSSVGFLSLHWISVALGFFLQSGCLSAVWTTMSLLSMSDVFVLLTLALGPCGVPVSRRMCNLAYVSWILAINTFVLGCLGLFDIAAVKPRPPMPAAFAGIQDSMLVVFLGANLLTGLVNLTLQPLLVPSRAAMLILLVYSLLWSAPVAMLHTRGITLKFW